MNFVNLSKIYLEMINRYQVSTFDVTSKLNDTNSLPSETMIEFYVDKNIEVDIPKLTMDLKQYIRFVSEYFITREDGKIIVCIIFRKKKNPIDFGFEFSIN
jgi:hypothetical protein